MTYYLFMVIIETPIFSKVIQELLTDEEYLLLQSELVDFPDTGAIIPGSGVLRKVRWKIAGKGKQGGIRTIYYWYVSSDTLLMLYAYPKSKKDDLTPKQLKALKTLIEEDI